MVIGTGIDITEISRISLALEKHGERFRNRVYTQAEIAYCIAKKNSAESFAARFAAKEAGAKALGTGIGHGVTWREIEVSRQPGSRPTLVFHGRAGEISKRLGITRVSLSITHSRDLSAAFVIAEDGY